MLIARVEAIARIRGTPRTRPAAAASRRSGNPAAPVCSIASLSIRARLDWLATALHSMRLPPGITLLPRSLHRGRYSGSESGAEPIASDSGRLARAGNPICAGTVQALWLAPVQETVRWAGLKCCRVRYGGG